jgi:ATP-binding cassette subfamily G (WHITE) protein 2 (SNQ2)
MCITESAISLIRSTLLFLDEPTSGLDGQSSFMILQFLKTLASHGQAVLCTIHQPSAALFAEFDQLLLLKSGGKVSLVELTLLNFQTVYFGGIAEMNDYFSNQGVPIPSTTNPAEFMIDVVSGSKSNGRDWAQVWLESQARADRMKELEELNSLNSETSPREEDNYEYASPFSAQVAIVCERAFVQVC